MPKKSNSHFPMKMTFMCLNLSLLKLRRKMKLKASTQASQNHESKSTVKQPAIATRHLKKLISRKSSKIKDFRFRGV